MASGDDISSITLKRIARPQNYPVENISICRKGDHNFRIGIACMQGFRNQMEDAHVAIPQLPSHPNVGLFGVFDGHKGSGAAHWFSENVGLAIDRLSHFTEETLKQSIIDLDREYFCSTGDTTSGTTAILCTVEICENSVNPFKVTIAHVGDSRFYVGRLGTSEYRCMTTDHKPSNPEEKQRIVAAGGNVFRGRVDSLLAVSRALGDHYYKGRKDLPPDKQKVIAVPDVTCTYLEDTDYLFICCDGILEPQNFTNDGAGIFNFFYGKQVNNTWKDTAAVLAELVQVLLQSGSKDNMTAMIVEFKNGLDYNSGQEFLAGEFYGDYGNPSYVDAYKSDCERNGKTVEEVRGLWRTRKEMMYKKRDDFGKSLGDDDVI